MSRRVPVLLLATDLISEAGVATVLRSRPEVRLVEQDDAGPETVVLVVTDQIDTTTRRALRSLQVRGLPRVVLLARELDDVELLGAVEIGVSAVLRRAEATADALVRLVRAVAAGEGVLPPDLLGRLLSRASLQPTAGSVGRAGMSARETEVLRLVADGLDTREIGEALRYSQRTVKSILSDVTNRFQLRNRSHAVAFALREGLI